MALVEQVTQVAKMENLVQVAYPQELQVALVEQVAQVAKMENLVQVAYPQELQVALAVQMAQAAQMPSLSGSTPGQTGGWEDLGGPDPSNYKPDDDSAKLKTPGATLKQVKDVVTKGAKPAMAMAGVKEEYEEDEELLEETGDEDEEEEVVAEAKHEEEEEEGIS